MSQGENRAGGGFRIESEVALSSEWLPVDAFRRVYPDRAAAVAIAIEGVDDPGVEEVRVVDVAAGAVVWRSTDEDYE